MQESYPHEIRRFADGEPVPDGYLPLTPQEFAELDKMTPDERAEWLKEHGRRDGKEEFREALTQGQPPEESRATFPRGIGRPDVAPRGVGHVPKGRQNVRRHQGR